MSEDDVDVEERLRIMLGRRTMWGRALAARLLRLEPSIEAIADEEIPRMSGVVRCELCGLQLYDHPEHPGFPWATVLCDGSLAKL